MHLLPLCRIFPSGGIFYNKLECLTSGLRGQCFLSFQYNTKILELKLKPVVSFLLGMATLVNKIPLKIWFSLFFSWAFGCRISLDEELMFSERAEAKYIAAAVHYIDL